MSVETMKKKKRFKLPGTYVLLIYIILIAAVLTYILPAGTYDTYLDEATGKTLVTAGTFHFIERTPVNFFDAIMAITAGLTKGSSIIFSVFLLSGAFSVINATGSIEAVVDSMAAKLQERVLLLIPVIMALMSVLGYLGIVVNQTIVFIPIGLVIARKLKLDPIVGLSMMYLATYSGFIGSGMDPFTVVVAQTIAGVPLLSGIAYRTIVFLLLLVSAILYLMRYAKKVMKDPSLSALGTADYDWAVEIHEGNKTEFNFRHKVILALIFIFLGIYIYGALNLGFGIAHLNTIFIILAIVSGVIGKMSPEDMSKEFVDGCKMAVFSAILIGFATAISVVLTQGNVIYTIIYYCSLPLSHISTMFSAVFMFFFNLIFNLFVPSGSGQAAVVMPILAPLGDVIGLSKQVIISAYKYGDGVSNLIIPTSGTLMGFIGLAKVPYDKWLKFIMPLIGIWVGISMLAVIIGVIIGF
ncbi:MAG: hypothetical protein PWP51_747 [Clostridiales bacterium]|jgi:uncharacterized ion transporter superfamily protein YfcC|uniref:YfcC family protein n=1 Tax=Fusibacter paucivorans TaxID=76009 RepID=A0ABS5PS32_9FIRM|nr:TIGR00366 family protein [Fusibacter paucivorans]MBS7527980.1 YfcC family protein [Fusibacter paucivorans]MDK2865927.1 hypothetical protein [Clostridiales bacterium]MDN5298194.1 hypothetical protein [Clostridiales bacterium]